MTRQLTGGLVAVALPATAYWNDEATYNRPRQDRHLLSNGQLVVRELPPAGGEITLGGDANIWTYADLQVLLALRAEPNVTLEWDGMTIECVWLRPTEVEFTPVLPGLVAPQDDDLYRVIIRLYGASPT
jgi:hypothetical protein